MRTYIVYGNSRRIGAIGLPQMWVRRVVASTGSEAKDKARELLYVGGHEHVHVERVMEDGDAKTSDA